ncbi:unnamed protein product [Moneuplotes crassus]|uniref:Uncharacterized protein n=1 Tax=Euplotes crassus TaxID=5936 RepID=A0AAD1XR84_EUPCR|nr:unnamed protein product [Moneuplotes crassus]
MTISLYESLMFREKRYHKLPYVYFDYSSIDNDVVPYPQHKRDFSKIFSKLGITRVDIKINGTTEKKFLHKIYQRNTDCSWKNLDYFSYQYADLQKYQEIPVWVPGSEIKIPARRFFFHLISCTLDCISLERFILDGKVLT